MDTNLLWTGAMWHEKETMDKRDFVAGDVFWIPSEEELNKQKSISLTKALLKTTNQSCVPSCTAHSLCHLISIQNIIESSTQDIFVDPKDQWENNQWRPTVCSWRWDYLEVALKTANKNWVKGTIKGKPFTFELDGYNYESRTTFWKDLIFKLIAYRLRNSWPLYVAFRGNGQVSLEISRGERVTEITLAEDSYWHAVILTWIKFDDNWNLERVEFINSWSPNTENTEEEKLISSFKIKWDLFSKLIDNGIFWRRYFLSFDKANMPTENLFIDYNVWSEPEHTEAVKRAKEFGIVKWVKTDIWYKLEPHVPISRLQVILIVYRVAMRLLKKLGKE